MKISDRFAFDTNVLVSALAFPGSIPRKALDLAARLGTIVASDATLLELHRTLRRPKLSRYFGRAEQDAFFRVFAAEVTLVEVNEQITLCRDPRDDKFLELAVAGKASHLITGDRDLLALDPFQSTRIITPANIVGELERR